MVVVVDLAIRDVEAAAGGVGAPRRPRQPGRAVKRQERRVELRHQAARRGELDHPLAVVADREEGAALRHPLHRLRVPDAEYGRVEVLRLVVAVPEHTVDGAHHVNFRAHAVSDEDPVRGGVVRQALGVATGVERRAQRGERVRGVEPPVGAEGDLVDAVGIVIGDEEAAGRERGPDRLAGEAQGVRRALQAAGEGGLVVVGAGVHRHLVHLAVDHDEPVRDGVVRQPRGVRARERPPRGVDRVDERRRQRGALSRRGAEAREQELEREDDRAADLRRRVVHIRTTRGADMVFRYAPERIEPAGVPGTFRSGRGASARPRLSWPGACIAEHRRADRPCRVSLSWPPLSQSPGGGTAGFASKEQPAGDGRD